MKILLISLGCDKNLVDTEEMLGLLASRGFEMTDDEAEADVIIINTCCFIHDAKEESIQNILEMAEYKKKGKLKALIVAGCLAQRYRQEILDEIPEVDVVLGTTAYDQILDALDAALVGRTEVRIADLKALPMVKTKRQVTTGGHYAYLKIAEGCDKHCTYCIIPKIRGAFRSVPMERLLKAAEELAEQGAKELILVAQETTLYGKDIYGEKRLPVLLRELCKIKGIRWIRILYCYPEEITDELIQTIKEEPKICHYLDIPIQHANDEILRRMGRRTTKQEIIDTVEKLRREIPDICLRTTLITGFPGETSAQHEELMEFVDEIPEGEKSNQIFLDGYICKEPIYRKTPLGREIADLLIAVNRSYGKSDYIPCICWGRNARFASGFEIGGHVQVYGRIQSREYMKKLDEENVERRVAFEVSVSKLELMEENFE